MNCYRRACLPLAQQKQQEQQLAFQQQQLELQREQQQWEREQRQWEREQQLAARANRAAQQESQLAASGGPTGTDGETKTKKTGYGIGPRPLSSQRKDLIY